MYSLFIDKNNNIMVKHKDEVLELYKSNINESIEGNIYVGKIKNVVKGIQTAFVDIGEGKKVFFQYESSEEEHISANKLIVLQIKRDSVGNKMPIATTNIKLTGKYIILTPKDKHISISKKITDSNEIKRLKLLVNNEKTDYGVIIRTNAVGEKENILNELRLLIQTWEDIINVKHKDIKLVYSSEGIFKKLIKDLTDKNIDCIYVDEDKIDKVNNILKDLDFNIPVSILNIEDQIENELVKISKKKVWLKSGGNIIIEKTEALTSIDVNSGSYTGKVNLEETVKRINIEATKEIIKQIKLRNLCGIIIIDYINMNNEESKTEVLNEFLNAIKKERTKMEVLGFTKLNLLEVTRKCI